MLRILRHYVGKECPICGKAAHAELTPFCSKRCADIDLARWFSSSYSVPVVEHDDLPDDEEGDIEIKQ